MKLKRAILLALLLTLVLAGIAAADEPWTYAAVKCSGITHAALMTVLQDYTTQYGFDHNLPVGDNPAAVFIWQAAHPAIVNGFLSSVGCPPALNDDGTALTFWFKLYTPVYAHLKGLE